ncbi:MAG: short-chain dehydrogenase/reductase [Actinomycetota bacterium]|nr:short-chain dehydrogenase/reductase [Actinomycetota bacterium]
MDLQLAGKSAVITGASKGIGLGCALALASEGCDVHIAARSADTLAAAAAEIRAAAPDAEVTAHAVDLSSSDDQAALVAATGVPDIWVNNAGAIPGGDISTIGEDTWRQAWDLKVFGYINLCRHIFPAMCERGSGVILNVIGAAADRPQPNYIAGAVGNSGLVGLSKALGSRSLQQGVRCLAVNPGLIVTDRMSDLLRRMATDELGDPERWEELIPTDPAPGTVEQVSDVVTFLVSEKASHVSGVVLTIDGGAASR